MSNSNLKGNGDFMLHDYKDIQGVLVKKHRSVFGKYIIVIEENDIRTKIIVGKSIYNNAKIGTKWTIGHINGQLINIRPGFCNTLD